MSYGGGCRREPGRIGQAQGVGVAARLLDEPFGKLAAIRVVVRNAAPRQHFLDQDAEDIEPLARGSAVDQTTVKPTGRPALSLLLERPSSGLGMDETIGFEPGARSLI